jgi:hypothetical protein
VEEDSVGGHDPHRVVAQVKKKNIEKYGMSMTP